MVEPLTSSIYEWVREKLAWMGFLRPTYFERIEIAKVRHIEKQKQQQEQSLKGVTDEEHLDRLRLKFEEFKRDVFEDDDDAFWLKRY